MGLKLHFNPFTGTFDWVSTSTSGDGQVVSPEGSLSNTTEDPPRVLVYSSGNDAVRTASNLSIATAPAIGVIVRKPAVQVATVLYYGELDGYSGLTPGVDLFLGPAGTLIEAADLPTGPGQIIQKVGKALSTTTVLFFFHAPVLL